MLVPDGADPEAREHVSGSGEVVAGVTQSVDLAQRFKKAVEREREAFIVEVGGGALDLAIEGDRSGGLAPIHPGAGKPGPDRVIPPWM